MTYRLAILASGSGTNAEEIFRYFKGHPSIKIVLLLSNNPEAYVLERARKFSVQASVFNRQQFRESDEVLTWLRNEKVTHIVLAGFLWLMPHNILKEFRDKIINIHPALLPQYGGKGMYGMKVHEAVKANKDPESGITIHLVNERYDEGLIIFQDRCIILPEDTPEAIAQKVHALEYKNYPAVIEKWVLNNNS